VRRIAPDEEVVRARLGERADVGLAANMVGEWFLALAGAEKVHPP
jgi:hypothetical protein